MGRPPQRKFKCLRCFLHTRIWTTCRKFEQWQVKKRKNKRESVNLDQSSSRANNLRIIFKQCMPILLWISSEGQGKMSLMI